MINENSKNNIRNSIFKTFNIKDEYIYDMLLSEIVETCNYIYLDIFYN